MAGLSVLLETHESNSMNPQIISKATLHSPKISSTSLLSPAAATTAASTSSFLQRCLLCRKELGEDNDIYMYRGDRAFCSVECRCRQIFMDEDACNSYCAKGAAAARSSRRATTGTAAGAGGVSFAY